MTAQLVALGELVNVQTGKLDANASSADGAYPFFTCAREPLRIAEWKYDLDAILIAGNGDLNVKHFRGRFDAYQRTYILDVKNTEVLDSRFLFHFMDKYVERLRQQSIGGIIKYIKLGMLTEAPIPLPPLEEQKRIAGILDQAAELCRLRTRALDKLNTLGQAIFHEMFGSVHSNPNGFDRVPLADLIKVSSGQGLTAKDMIPGEFPVYGGNGINGYHNEGPIGSDRIVIGRVGVYCGAVHVTKQPCWVTDNALLVKQLQPCSVTYLAEALRVADLNQYAGRAAQPLISGSRIYPVEILLPPKEKQDEFEKALRSMSQQQHVAQRAQAQSDKLFASLQDRAFRGEL